MPATISNQPKRLDLDLQQGSDFGPLVITVKDAAGAVVDLTGCTAAAQIRRTPQTGTPVAAFDVTTGDELGTITLTLSDTATAVIPCGARPSEAASRYVWDLDITWSDDRIETLLWGEVQVQAEVTRSLPGD